MTIADFFPTKKSWKRMLFCAFFGHSTKTLRELETQSEFDAWVETIWGLAAFVGFFSMIYVITKLVIYFFY